MTGRYIEGFHIFPPPTINAVASLVLT